MITQSQQLSSLGYPEANDLHLFRSEEGIISQREGKNKFLALLNYPTTVQFSGKAIRKMDAEYNKNANASTIEVYANLKSGKKISIFSINTNFFGRVQADRNTNQTTIDYHVSPFNYDSSRKSFESVFGSERSFSVFDLKDWETDNGDVVTSFGAEYLLGYVTVSETHKFVSKFFNTDEFSEKTLMQIGVKENNDWDLTLCQRQGVPQELVDSEAIHVISHEEKELKIQASGVNSTPEHFTCPITKEMMTNPVIAPDGYSYEQSVIIEWLKKTAVSPMTRQVMTIEQLIPNRQLKEAIDYYNNSSK